MAAARYCARARLYCKDVLHHVASLGRCELSVLSQD